MPPIYRLDALKSDYDSMKNMMFGDCPDFDVLMDFIADLEQEINSLNAE